MPDKIIFGPLLSTYKVINIAIDFQNWSIPLHGHDYDQGLLKQFSIAAQSYYDINSQYSK